MQLSKSNVCTITSFLKIQQWNIAYNLTQACIYEHEKWKKYTEEEHVSSNVQECREWLMRTQRLGSDTWSQDFVFESQMIMSHEENDYMSFTNNPLLKIITMVEDFIHFGGDPSQGRSCFEMATRSLATFVRSHRSLRSRARSLTSLTPSWDSWKFWICVHTVIAFHRKKPVFGAH